MKQSEPPEFLLYEPLICSTVTLPRQTVPRGKPRPQRVNGVKDEIAIILLIVLEKCNLNVRVFYGCFERVR